MAYHIKKASSIIQPGREIYYKGDQTWTDVYTDRKTYSSESDATAELYRYGGQVVDEG